jgi:integrase
MSASTIRQVHWILSAVLGAAVRWDWIRSNPADVARKPRQPTPQPEPPTAAEAARIIEAAWAGGDEQWGTLVWLVMVTGMRRAEVLALRWTDIVAIRRNYVRTHSCGIEKDTKTRQRAGSHSTPRRSPFSRGIGSDTTRECGVSVSNRPQRPSRSRTTPWLTGRWTQRCDPSLRLDVRQARDRWPSARVAALLGDRALTAGVDPRTVAGRLGHGGGGATTLRVYAAWVGEANRRAAEILGRRMHHRPSI